METFFNKYFWVVLLALLATAAGFAAAGANRVIASAFLMPTPKPMVLETVGKKARSRSNRAEVIMARSLFDSSKLAPMPEEEAGEEEQEGAGDEIGLAEDGELGENVPLSPLNVQVTGTVVSSIPSSSNASIKDGGETRLYFEGDTLKEGAVIYAIRRDAVYIVRNGKLERLALGAKKGGGKPGGSSGRGHKPSSAARRRGASASLRDGIKKTGPYEYEVDRAMLDEQLQDLNKLGSQARIIPHYKDGRADGFKLVGVRPGSLYTLLGVRSGDIIRRVNGEEINSPTKALALYDKLKSTSNVTVDIERRGRPQTLTFHIK